MRCNLSEYRACSTSLLPLHQNTNGTNLSLHYIHHFGGVCSFKSTARYLGVLRWTPSSLAAFIPYRYPLASPLTNLSKFEKTFHRLMLICPDSTCDWLCKLSKKDLLPFIPRKPKRRPENFPQSNPLIQTSTRIILDKEDKKLVSNRLMLLLGIWNVHL
jgi:hypothetical protein